MGYQYRAVAIGEEGLSHHGILGMKWGKKNGPPYPLGASDHSASEKKAGWRKSLDGGGEKRTKYKSTSVSAAVAKAQNKKVDKSFQKWKENTEKRQNAISLGKRKNEKRLQYEDYKNREKRIEEKYLIELDEINNKYNEINDKFGLDDKQYLDYINALNDSDNRRIKDLRANKELSKSAKREYKQANKEYKKALRGNTTYRKGQIKKEVLSDISRKHLSEAKRVEKQLKQDPNNKSLQKRYSKLMSQHDVERAKARRAPEIAANRSQAKANAKRIMTKTAKIAITTAAINAGIKALNGTTMNIQMDGDSVRRKIKAGKEVFKYI